MPEVDDSPSLQSQIDAAVLANDMGLADDLYRRQIGTADLARTRDPGEPAPVAEVPVEGQVEDAAEPAGPSPSDVDQGMGGSGMDEYVPYDSLSEDEKDTAFEGVMSLSEPGVSEGIFKREWPGAEYDRNREFGDAALRAVSGSLDVLRVLETVGIADHPALVRWIVSVGHLLASQPGDPSSISTNLGASKQMVGMNTAQIEAKIDSLEDAIDAAQARNDTTKAQLLFETQQGLYQQLPGGREPIVGGSGRTA